MVIVVRGPVYHSYTLFLLDLRQGKHKLKFWLKNILQFQSCSIPFSWFLLLPSKSNKNRSLLLVLCNFEIWEYFWAKTSVYVLLVYTVWLLGGLSNFPMFLSVKTLLKVPILYGKLGLSSLFFPSLYLLTQFLKNKFE